MVVPSEIELRRDDYCRMYDLKIVDLIGFGVDGYVWQTNRETVVKVCRNVAPFKNELDVYLRLKSLRLRKLQGFDIPWLINHDERLWTLELSFVSPPFVLDFAAATLNRNSGSDFSSEFLAEKQRLFGSDWPDVQRLLDGLRLYGINFLDVHLGNIRVRK